MRVGSGSLRRDRGALTLTVPYPGLIRRCNSLKTAHWFDRLGINPNRSRLVVFLTAAGSVSVAVLPACAWVVSPGRCGYGHRAPISLSGRRPLLGLGSELIGAGRRRRSPRPRRAGRRRNRRRVAPGRRRCALGARRRRTGATCGGPVPRRRRPPGDVGDVAGQRRGQAGLGSPSRRQPDPHEHPAVGVAVLRAGRERSAETVRRAACRWG